MADDERLEQEPGLDPVEPEIPLTGDDTGLDLDDDFEETTLTGRQKLWIAVATGVSFLLFSILLFPLDILVRSRLQNPEQPFQADFTALNLNLFGSDEIQDLQFRSGGFSLSSPAVESSLSWFGMMRRDLDGTVRMPESVSIQAGDLALKGQQAALKFSLPGALEIPASNWIGEIELELKDVRFSSLPGRIPLPISPEDLEVPQGTIRLKFTGGGVDFEGSRIQTNLFLISISGGGQIRGSLATMQLKSRICLRPVSDLQQENRAIYDFYTAFGGAGGGQLCFKLEGNLSNPSFIPEQQANPSPAGADEAIEAEEADPGPEPATENPDEEVTPDTGEQESQEKL